MNREIPIVGDEYVDMEFGTARVKVTPCHDPNDFEMGKRHNLEQILVINEDATVNENGGKYQGMDRYECRKAVITDLEEGGYLVKIEDHEHNVGTCYRCGTTVEPIIGSKPSGSSRWRRSQSPRWTWSRKARPGSCPTAFQDLPALDGKRARLVHLAASCGGATASRRSTATTAAR